MMTFSGWAAAGGCAAAGAAAGAFAGAVTGPAAGAAAGAQAAATSRHPSTTTPAIDRPERSGARARIFVLPRARGALARTVTLPGVQVAARDPSSRKALVGGATPASSV